MNIRFPNCSQHMNKPVEIIECVRSNVDVGRLLGINAFSLEKLLAMDPEFLVRARAWLGFKPRVVDTSPN